MEKWIFRTIIYSRKFYQKSNYRKGKNVNGEEVKSFMACIGGTCCKYNASTYHHALQNLKTMVHGDDGVTAGMKFQPGLLGGKLA